MALVVCKECGGQVSTKAQACPGCGAMRKRISQVRAWQWLFIAAALAAVGAGLHAALQKVVGWKVELTGASVVSRVPYLSMDFTVENRNFFAVKSVVVSCVHRGESGEILYAEETDIPLLQPIPARTTAAISEVDLEFDLDQFAVKSSVCEVIGAGIFS